MPSSALKSFSRSGSFPTSQFFTTGGQSIQASASILSKNIQDWFPLGLTALISLQSKGLSRVFSNTTVQKHQFFCAQPSLWSNSHIHTRLLEKLSVSQSVQLLSPVRFFATPWTTAYQASLFITNTQSPPKPMSIELVMPSSHLILCRLLLLPPVLPSIRVFSNESTLHIRWPKYWSFSFSINPSNEHPGLISFRMNWLDRLAVQGTLKSLLQHHNSKASILRHSAFFTVQLSHPYMTTGKTTALTRWTFAGKVMSLFLNMLSRLVITFLPRSKCLLISWLQSPSAVILEPPKIKSDTVPHLFPMKWWDQMPWSYFSECWALSQLFHSPLSSRGFLAPPLSAIKVVSSAYLRLLMYLGNLDSSLCFFQPSVSHDVLCK